MAWRRVANGGGTIVTCDGEGCDARSQTGQLHPSMHRYWLRSTQGWGRGGLRATQYGAGTAGKDLCPRCLERDRAALARRRRHVSPRRTEAV